MSIKKGTLSKLNKELIRYNIKAESIAKAATFKVKSTELIRLVLKGDAADKNNIIEFLADCVIREKKRVIEISKKIEQL